MTPASITNSLGGGSSADGLIEACRDLLASGLSEAASVWGTFDLSLARFAPRALELVACRLDRLGVARTPESLREAMTRTAVADLAIAIACSDGVALAWEALVARLSPRLAGLARKRGVSTAEARVLASDVLAEMSVPATQQHPRKLIATYEGSGSLFGWAAVILIRRLGRARLRDAGREVAPVSELAAAGVARSDPPDHRLPDPLEALARADTARQLAGALKGAWAELSGRERLALSCRFLDGIPQTEIATILRVSEPHTSRIITGAVERLRRVVRNRMGTASTDQESGWPALVEVIRRSMVTASASAPLPDQSSLPSRKGPR